MLNTRYEERPPRGTGTQRNADGEDGTEADVQTKEIGYVRPARITVGAFVEIINLGETTYDALLRPNKARNLCVRRRGTDIDCRTVVEQGHGLLPIVTVEHPYKPLWTLIAKVN
ncbi:hypothetical protein SARC_07346 [Sphaeroforma arctica JP610]|uniref:Uncharacterized protein n=1 Tax=Sphaeroforma arctica JP610 TaxID=667725 RepID=A0A0L0FWG6_9EUKA|nr:hypothetical protein SARC_07346 [Sphaeroforma arctica JP610]KNC80298.1 hypothetical protein SARC_07346 [Sphaeroforma arctica JP610]|eukprot:XP_014154200.1 hypothetical protein SARC_07346 [Sphaeroforma arctica JP610]